MSKKLRTMLFVTVLATVEVLAQSPAKMSYQAVIRNASNALVINHTVSMQISILQGSASGTAVYTETQRPVTNGNGLISIEIGSGTVVSGNFDAIQWTNGPYFIKTETDPTGGTNYTITGTSQLLSVPYALHAKSAETITGKITETDPVFGVSVAKSITATDTARWNSKLKSEIDPVFGASVAKGITSTDTTRWNHTLKSETDPFFGASIAKGITAADTIRWNKKKLEKESQTIADVASLGNAVNTQLKNVTNPTDAQDAATKAYVDELESKVAAMKGMMIDAGIYAITDVDGNSYKIKKIGQQVWMTENLKTSRYNNGTAIPLVADNTAWDNLATAGYCWYNNDSAKYASAYGALYNWYTVVTGNLCPTGWHVPTDAEWTTLNNYLGGLSNAGGPLKETGTKYWTSPNTGATNETGFTARPGGYRNNYGSFWGAGNFGFWWSSIEVSAGAAWYQILYYDLINASISLSYKKYGFSVRCLKD